MNILVCGSRDIADTTGTTLPPEQEAERLKPKLEQYKRIHKVLHDLVYIHSKQRSDTDNWLPTDITIIEGGARGVDSAAADFAHVNFCQHRMFPAAWDLYGKAAGTIRNQQMLDEGKPDLVVAFPSKNSKGTWHMVRIAKKAGVPVEIYKVE